MQASLIDLQTGFCCHFFEMKCHPQWRPWICWDYAADCSFNEAVEKEKSIAVLGNTSTFKWIPGLNQNLMTFLQLLSVQEQPLHFFQTRLFYSWQIHPWINLGQVALCHCPCPRSEPLQTFGFLTSTFCCHFCHVTSTGQELKHSGMSTDQEETGTRKTTRQLSSLRKQRQGKLVLPV